MSNSSSTLPPFPSDTDAFKEFQPFSLSLSIPRYRPEIAELDSSEPHEIRAHPNLLAFQPRLRKRRRSDRRSSKKKPLQRKRKSIRSSFDEKDTTPDTVLAKDAQTVTPLSARRRSARRAAARASENMKADPSGNDVADHSENDVEHSDDADFM